MSLEAFVSLPRERSALTTHAGALPRELLGSGNPDLRRTDAIRGTPLGSVPSEAENLTSIGVESSPLTFGQRVADGLAKRMGSWEFIIGQGVGLAGWITLNVLAWSYHWDPYPFIFLNLALSCQAAFAAPIIMMSQNRQAAQDRISAEIDHRVNLKAEAGVETILERLDKIQEELDVLKGSGTKAHTPAVPTPLAKAA